MKQRAYRGRGGVRFIVKCKKILQYACSLSFEKCQLGAKGCWHIFSHHRDTEFTECEFFSYPIRKCRWAEKAQPFGQYLSSLLIEFDRCHEHQTGEIICSLLVIRAHLVPHSGTEDFDLSQGPWGQIKKTILSVYSVSLW